MIMALGGGCQTEEKAKNHRSKGRAHCARKHQTSWQPDVADENRREKTYPFATRRTGQGESSRCTGHRLKETTAEEPVTGES
ncbi:hypothetical protein U0070_015323 [Myodes glareolus]|uniref:Uncharacterized protein n=1 Tax=Myodes glareolus TaxID=447135 RepID=A0AAW0K1I1_MYOGA